MGGSAPPAERAGAGERTGGAGAAGGNGAGETLGPKGCCGPPPPRRWLLPRRLLVTRFAAACHGTPGAVVFLSVGSLLFSFFFWSFFFLFCFLFGWVLVVGAALKEGCTTKGGGMDAPPGAALKAGRAKKGQGASAALKCGAGQPLKLGGALPEALEKWSRPRPAEQCLSAAVPVSGGLSAAALSRHGARRGEWGRSGAAGKRCASHHDARKGCGVGNERRGRPGCRPGAEGARCSTLLAGAHPPRGRDAARCWRARTRWPPRWPRARTRWPPRWPRRRGGRAGEGARRSRGKAGERERRGPAGEGGRGRRRAGGEREREGERCAAGSEQSE